jgi:hypothetical protein
MSSKRAPSGRVWRLADQRALRTHLCGAGRLPDLLRRAAASVGPHQGRAELRDRDPGRRRRRVPVPPQDPPTRIRHAPFGRVSVSRRGARAARRRSSGFALSLQIAHTHDRSRLQRVSRYLRSRLVPTKKKMTVQPAEMDGLDPAYFQRLDRPLSTGCCRSRLVPRTAGLRQKRTFLLRVPLNALLRLKGNLGWSLGLWESRHPA